MKQKLWTLAFVWALLNFFHGQTNKDETQGHLSTSTPKNLVTPQSPVCESMKYFPGDPVIEPCFQQ